VNLWEDYQTMDPKLILQISKVVYKRFPEVDGKKPRVRKQPRANGAKPKKNAENPTYLLTFKGQGQGPGGRKIPRLVRVVASARGKIIKMTTSRG
jgi:hypothetical protein